jgi:hypothetical protein
LDCSRATKYSLPSPTTHESKSAENPASLAGGPGSKTDAGPQDTPANDHGASQINTGLSLRQIMALPTADWQILRQQVHSEPRTQNPAHRSAEAASHHSSNQGPAEKGGCPFTTDPTEAQETWIKSLNPMI